MTAKKAAEPKPRPRNAVLGEDEWHFGPSWKRSTGDFVESHCGRWRRMHAPAGLRVATR